MIPEYRSFKENENGTWDCEVNHPVFGWIPYTASRDDGAKVNTDLINEFVKGGLIDDIQA